MYVYITTDDPNVINMLLISCSRYLWCINYSWSGLDLYEYFTLYNYNGTKNAKWLANSVDINKITLTKNGIDSIQEHQNSRLLAVTLNAVVACMGCVVWLAMLLGIIKPASWALTGYPNCIEFTDPVQLMCVTAWRSGISCEAIVKYHNNYNNVVLNVIFCRIWCATCL